ncbi:MAG TPA: sodium/solute symporter [Saprospiraceae bacterium]|nr:sodium/solute symporter [Saprospiraceae bacterium]
MFATLDIVIFVVYLLGIVALGLYMSRTKEGTEKTAEDYFLASKSLPWWAIGTSLIAANISAEQMIGMSGQAFGMGIAIASYELMAAATLIIVGKYFLPIFIEKNLFTIPQFVKERYSDELKTILAIFWLFLFTFVNLSTVLLLGAMALDTIIGTGDKSLLLYGIIGLALISAAYSLYGGLTAVAWTDVVQVVLLILGGIITTYLACANLTPSGGFVDGVQHIYSTLPEKFHMILGSDHPMYKELPGIAVLVGGMWVANLYYWGFNQYIIQRALAAKDIKEAQKGLVLAGFLKILIPFIVVVPGIAAYSYYAGGAGTSVVEGAATALQVDNPPFQANDNAYPWLIKNLIPTGFKGLVVAALAAAIISSLASMMNSISTIFTMDIYQQYINKNASSKTTVNVGRISAAVALVIAMIIAPMLANGRGIFNVIQEYTAVVSPGILAVFMLGLFYKKANNRGAIIGILFSIVFALGLKFSNLGLPWMHETALVFVITCLVIAGVSYVTGKGLDDQYAIRTDGSTFTTSSAFNISSFIILLILAFLYAAFW